MKKTIIFLIVISILVGGGIWLYDLTKIEEPQTQAEKDINQSNYQAKKVVQK